MLPFVILSLENEDDREFMAELFINYQRLLLREIGQILQGRDDAEDVLQTLLVKLIDKVELLRGLEEKPLVGYLATAARHTAISQLRKLKQTAGPSLDTDLWLNEVLALHGDPVEEAILRRESVSALGAIWSDLDRRTRYILEARYFMGLSFDEIAEDIGVQPDSARMALSRARNNAKDLLREKSVITSLL